MKYKIAFFLFDLLSAFVIGANRHLRICCDPFKGMLYLTKSVGSSLTPKTLGICEKELNRFIECLPRFSHGINVGAAEGYYTVGLRTSGVCEKITAWETTEHGRHPLASLAQMNDVSGSLEVRSSCSPPDLANELRNLSGTPTLVVIDCEGFEGPVLEDLDGALLACCTLFIETHDQMNPGVHGRSLAKLCATHVVVERTPEKRAASGLPQMLPLLLRVFRLPGFRRVAMSERRCPDIRWLLCTPRPIAAQA